MPVSLVQYALGAVSGVFVGFTLGLVGGGGSILAVPLIVYVVGVADPHLAIGTTAVAVAASAAINLMTHARAGIVVGLRGPFRRCRHRGRVSRDRAWARPSRARSFCSCSRC